MRRLLVVGTLVLTLGAVPAVASATSHVPFFRSPSGNIVCGSDAKAILCDREDGYTVRLKVHHTAEALQLNADDTFDRDQTVLRYGRFWSRGHFGCMMTTTDLLCASRVTGYGFAFNNNRFKRIKLNLGED